MVVGVTIGPMPKNVFLRVPVVAASPVGDRRGRSQSIPAGIMHDFYPSQTKNLPFWKAERTFQSVFSTHVSKGVSTGFGLLNVETGRNAEL
jgi:hypothetical protein